MKKVVFYARYSSENQDNYSIEAQLSEMEAFCKKQDWTIYPVKFIDKAVSGSSSDRDEFKKLAD